MIVKNHFIVSFIATMIIFGMCNTLSALTLLTDTNQQLIGAEDVVVNGELYNVSFQEGFAPTLFHDGWDWQFTFTSQADADAASQALIDTVLVGNYDYDATSTYGIESGWDRGVILTPFSTYLESLLQENIQCSAAVNYSGEDAWLLTHFGISDFVDYVERADDFSTASATSAALYVYAVWTSAASPVPEPATMLLFGIGLVGIAGVSRRKK